MTRIADCGTEVVLRPGDIVICRECGYRILYKKRTKQSKFPPTGPFKSSHLLLRNKDLSCFRPLYQSYNLRPDRPGPGYRTRLCRGQFCISHAIELCRLDLRAQYNSSENVDMFPLQRCTLERGIGNRQLSVYSITSSRQYFHIALPSSFHLPAHATH